MPEPPPVSSVALSTEEISKQNVLKRNRHYLFEILHNNQTDLVRLATALSMDCIINKQDEQKIIIGKHKADNVTLLLNKLEQKLDKQPEILSKLFKIMDHFEGELHTHVIGMRKETNGDDEDSITTGKRRRSMFVCLHVHCS